MVSEHNRTSEILNIIGQRNKYVGFCTKHKHKTCRTKTELQQNVNVSHLTFH